MTAPLTHIQLPSLAQKITKSGITELQVHLSSFNCTIKRKGRSRNYTLTGEHSSLNRAYPSLETLMLSKASPKWTRVIQSIDQSLERTTAQESTINYDIRNISTHLVKMERIFLIEAIATYGLTLKRFAYNKHYRVTGTIEQFNALQENLVTQSPEPELRRTGEFMNAWLNRRYSMADYGYAEAITPAVIKSPLDLVKDKPSITLSELCYLSGCTMKEARQAIDDYELL
ncbi:conserved hypothetical protein [Vibrio chagasii]|nr:conserved hypothetical protein [Vibrio chagasii]